MSYVTCPSCKSASAPGTTCSYCGNPLPQSNAATKGSDLNFLSSYVSDDEEKPPVKPTATKPRTSFRNAPYSSIGPTLLRVIGIVLLIGGSCHGSYIIYKMYLQISNASSSSYLQLAEPTILLWTIVLSIAIIEVIVAMVSGVFLYVIGATSGAVLDIWKFHFEGYN